MMDDRELFTRPVQDAPIAPDRFRTLGLERNPFTGAGPLVTLPGHDEALGTIRDWITSVATDASHPDRLAVLVGAAGIGKSRVLRELVTNAASPATMPLIDPGKGGLTDAQLLRAIIDAFGGTATGRTGMDLRRDIRLALADLPVGASPGLIIDDADFNGARLELIRNVLRDGADAGLWIVLAGQPDLADRLARRRSFRMLLGPVAHLDVLDQNASTELLRQRIESARVTPRTRPLVSPDATSAIVESAEGNPGRLLRLAEVSLLLAMRQGLETVERGTVRLAIQQLSSPRGERTTTGPVQAEIPLLEGIGGAGSSRTTTQRELWEGGSSDETAPD